MLLTVLDQKRVRGFQAINFKNFHGQGNKCISQEIGKPNENVVNWTNGHHAAFSMDIAKTTQHPRWHTSHSHMLLFFELSQFHAFFEASFAKRVANEKKLISPLKRTKRRFFRCFQFVLMNTSKYDKAWDGTFFCGRKSQTRSKKLISKQITLGFDKRRTRC